VVSRKRKIKIMGMKRPSGKKRGGPKIWGLFVMPKNSQGLANLGLGEEVGGLCLCSPMGNLGGGGKE